MTDPSPTIKYGYARTAPGEDTLPEQIAQLKAAGATLIFEDTETSGSAVLKPQYGEMLRLARPGDTIIISRLDRLARSLTTLVTELQMIFALDLNLISLNDDIDTGASPAPPFAQLVEAFAQFGRDVGSSQNLVVNVR